MIRILLASSSPRRRLLLEQAGVAFAHAHPGIDDAPLRPGEVTPEQWVASLAFLKASAGIERLPVDNPSDRWLVLGADTLVVQGERLIGQPADAAEASEIVRALADAEHRVLTGVCVLDPRRGDRHLFVDSASVRVGPLGEREIESYVAGGAWRGKAGAYNLHERLEAGWPISYEGDPTTIVGLPMRRLTALLSRLGVPMGSEPRAVAAS
jgi:septum formation protein